LKISQFLRPAVHPLRLQHVFQPVINHDRIRQLADLLLEWCLRLSLDLARLLALLQDFRSHSFQFCERIVAKAGFFDPLVLELQFAQQLGMVNHEHRPRIGYFRARHQFQQPFGRFELFRMVPEFQRRHFFQRHVARASYLEQRISRHRIEWLNAPVQQHRQAAKIPHVKLGLFLGRHDRDYLRREDRGRQPGNDLE